MNRVSAAKFGSVFLALSLLLISVPASAQRIVLLRPKSADDTLLQAFGRLKGELMAHDFEVIVVDADESDPSPKVLARVAEQVHAVATVSLLRSEGLASADVWISDRVTGKTSMRTIATAERREASSVLAVRAVDLLRTSLREFPPGERPPPEIVGASPERAPPHVRQWASVEPPRQRWSVEAGVALQSTLSRLGSVYGPSILLGYSPAERLGFALGFQGPLSGAHASNGGASIALTNEQLFAEAAYRVVARRPWSVDVTAAFGAHHFDVEGTAAPPYVGRSGSAWTALAAAGAELGLAITTGAGLFVSARAVFLLPRPVAEVAALDTAYGRPAFEGAAGLHVAF